MAKQIVRDTGHGYYIKSNGQSNWGIGTYGSLRATKEIHEKSVEERVKWYVDESKRLADDELARDAARKAK